MNTVSPDAPAMLVSVSEAARLKGVKKQTISEKLARLADRVPTMKRGREKIFSLALYDAAVGETTDPSRIVAQETAKDLRDEAPAAAERDPAYRQALTRKAELDADIKAIEVAKAKGELLPTADVVAAMERSAEAIVREIDQLPTFADELAAAVSKGGAAALRDALKQRARRLRETLARSMTVLAVSDDDDERAEEGAIA